LYVAEDHLLGWHRLTRGRHTLSFVCVGKDVRSNGFHLGLDTIILARVASPEKTEAPRLPSSVSELVKVLTTGDAVYRGMAAIALRDRGPAAREALPALAQALRDEETGVRMMAADAIARHKQGAVAVLDHLIRAAMVKGENVHVQRSVAIALGAIGPPASAALPVLSELEKIPRVGPTAATAIRQIRAARSTP